MSDTSEPVDHGQWMEWAPDRIGELEEEVAVAYAEGFADGFSKGYVDVAASLSYWDD